MDNKKLSQVSMPDGLAYFSGHCEENNHNHPCVGASIEGILVIARGVRKLFKFEEFDKAMRWYKFALQENGYVTK